MKRFRLQLLALFAISTFLFSSCEKTGPVPPKASSSSFGSSQNESNLLDSRQSVMFQIGEIGDNNKMEKGWLITNTGTIHTFQMDEENAWSPDDFSHSKLEFKALKNAIVDEIGSVSSKDLLSKVEMIETASKHRPSWSAESTGSETPTIAFVAFKINPDANFTCDAGCYDSNTSKLAVDHFDQVLLSYGIINENAESNAEIASNEITQWLQGLQQAQDF